MKSFQGLSLVLMAAALLLSFEATAVNGSGWSFSYSSSRTQNLRNLAVANNDDDIAPTKVIKTAASPGGLSVPDDDSVSNAALVKKVSAAHVKEEDDNDDDSTSSAKNTHKGSRNATNATHEYFPQAWNSTGEENTTSDMTVFADDDGIHGFADNVTYFDPVTTMNGGPISNNHTSDATFVPVEKDQPSTWPLVVLVLFLLATVGLCVSTVYKNRKRSGYQAVPVTTSLVV